MRKTRHKKTWRWNAVLKYQKSVPNPTAEAIKASIKERLAAPLRFFFAKFRWWQGRAAWPEREG